MKCAALFNYAEQESGWGDYKYIPLQLTIPNYLVGDVYYDVKIEEQAPLSTKVSDLQRGQVFNVSGMIESINIQAWHGNCNITIRLTNRPKDANPKDPNKNPRNNAPKQ